MGFHLHSNRNFFCYFLSDFFLEFLEEILQEFFQEKMILGFLLLGFFWSIPYKLLFSPVNFWWISSEIFQIVSEETLEEIFKETLVWTFGNSVGEIPKNILKERLEISIGIILETHFGKNCDEIPGKFFNSVVKKNCQRGS